MQACALDLHTLAGVCRRRAIRLLAVFGSAVRGTQGPASDLDLAVWIEDACVEPLTTLEAELSHLFPAERLDLVILNKAFPLVQFQVAKHGYPLFEACPGVFQAFCVSAAKRHADTAHLRSLDRICVDRFLRRQAPMLDRELINRKLAQLAQYLGELEPLRALSYEDYLRQPLSRYAAERLLQLLVDTAVDINAHLAVELTNTPPQDY
ncbi:MAG: nucleotidyltransferase domain-containing protein, partial [Nitrospinae bacterium]|nr:nucleotidyltransferase domain-containing protein [Nitrospinota bacterium]